MIARIEGKNIDWVIFGFDNEEDVSFGPGMHLQRLFTWLDKNHGKIDVITTLYEKEPEKIHLICRKVAPDIDLVWEVPDEPYTPELMG